MQTRGALSVGVVLSGLLVAAAEYLPLSSAPAPVREGSARNAGVPKSWRLLFVRDEDIWVANGDGTGQRKLIEDAEAPAWSPDHTKIAFFRRSNLWVADADGAHQRQLTDRWVPSAGDDGEWIWHSSRASWDPRAPRLTFSHEERFTVAPVGSKHSAVIHGCSIFDVSLEAPGEMRVHFDVYDEEAAFAFSWHSCPAWSPSGRYLAFARNGDIWIADRDTGYESPQPLAERAWRARPGSPWTWEWDVQRLAAVADYDAPTYRGSRCNLGVTGLSWSPTERRLVYGIERLRGSGVCEVRVLELEGDRYGRLRPRTHRKIADGLDPYFSPDGKWIVYSGQDSHADWYLWLASAGGKTRRRIIEDGWQPAW